MAKFDSDGLANQLSQVVRGVIEPLEQSGVDIISPEWVSNEVDKRLDPNSTSPALKTYASMMQIRILARRILARRHDPIKKAEDYIAGDSEDLFEGLLQDRYPAKRKDDFGEVERVYIRRDLMTKIDVNAICKRMERVGTALIQHVDALRAWDKSRG